MTDLNLTKDIICINETILNTNSEQSVELDYLLPDYYPDIFKLLKTQITPRIESQKISGNKLYIDGNSSVKVFYLTDNKSDISFIEQHIPFSKTLELAAEIENPTIHITPKCYFVNSRAVSQRRIDIRGGLNFKIKVTAPKETTAICGGKGDGMQFHLAPYSICDDRKYASKQFTVTDEIELGHSKPAFSSILNYNCSIVSTDYKIVANKVVCKGEILLHILYKPTIENAIPETMDFTIPISQIVDMQGIKEEYNCNTKFNLVSFNCAPKEHTGEENKILSCEFVINAFCVADKNKEILLADDAFSNSFEITSDTKTLSTECYLNEIKKTSVIKHTLETNSDNNISGVYDAFCNISDCNAKYEESSFKIDGTMEATILCYNNENIPFVIEKTFPFNIPLDITENAENITFNPNAEVLDVSYSISSPNTLELRTQVNINAPLYKTIKTNIISDITIDKEQKKETSPYALHLYYADKDESVWNIAKKFNTSMTAVMEENSLEDELLKEDTMLIIPVING